MYISVLTINSTEPWVEYDLADRYLHRAHVGWTYGG